MVRLSDQQRTTGGTENMREIRYDAWRYHDITALPHDQLAPDVWDRLLDKGQLTEGGARVRTTQQYAYMMSSRGLYPTYAQGRISHVVTSDLEEYVIGGRRECFDDISAEGRIGAGDTSRLLDNQDSERVSFVVDWLLE